MEHQSHIAALEARGKALGLRPARLYQLAGLSRTTMWRWRKGKNSPRIADFAEATARLEAVLTQAVITGQGRE